MSLTSYRAAPPRDGGGCEVAREVFGQPRVRRAVPHEGQQLAPECGDHSRTRGQQLAGWQSSSVLCRPGSDLLFRVLRRSTIGAEGFHGRVRDGIGCFTPRYGHQAGEERWAPSEERSPSRGVEARPQAVVPAKPERSEGQIFAPERGAKSFARGRSAPERGAEDLILTGDCVWLIGMSLRCWFAVSRPAGLFTAHDTLVATGVATMAVIFPALRTEACASPRRAGRIFKTEIKPIERLVPVSCARCRTSTPGLSTWWSTTALKGYLVLRGASRLDAFSGYPVRT